MELFGQQIMAGLANGAIYACVALALVMIYQAIGHVNFAQGEMAMFSTFIAWQLMQWGLALLGRVHRRRHHLLCRRRADRSAGVQAASAPRRS